jgi:hypothetical protein
MSGPLGHFEREASAAPEAGRGSLAILAAAIGDANGVS